MKSREMDSLETVEIVMMLEEGLVGVFGIRSGEMDRFDSARELVDWLEVRLSNQRPNKAACALLNKLAEDQQWPELAQGLDTPWRRQQIAEIVREMSRPQAI